MISASTLRRWHTYLGLFIAPSLLFFALTGALQIFNLHEAHGSYRPAVLLEKLSAVHKDQVFEAPHDHPPPPPETAPAAGTAAGHPADDDDDTLSASTLALKGFFCAVSIGLIMSTLVGVWMGTTQTRNRSVAWILLCAGAVIPIALVAI